MNKLITSTFTIFLLSFGLLFSQQHRPAPAPSGGTGHVICAQQFQQIQDNMDAISWQTSKLEAAIEGIHPHSFTTDQVAILMRKLTWDSDRLLLAKAAYPQTLDPENYCQLRSAFGLSSYARLLTCWVVDYDEKTSALAFIDSHRHMISPICDRAFAQLTSKIDAQPHQMTKTQHTLDALNQHYFTSDQVMILMKKLTWDSDRMKVAKAAYVRTLDYENFPAVGQVLYYSASKKALGKFLENYS